MFKKLIAIVSLLTATLAISGCAPEVTNELPKVEVTIQDAWIEAGTSEARVYATITNQLNGTVTLKGGTTPAAATVKLMDGFGPDEQVLADGVDVHVGQILILDATHKHLLLSDLTKPLKPGDKIDFTFEFDGTEPKTLEITAQ